MPGEDDARHESVEALAQVVVDGAACLPVLPHGIESYKINGILPGQHDPLYAVSVYHGSAQLKTITKSSGVKFRSSLSMGIVCVL